MRRYQICTSGQIIKGQWLHFGCEFSHMCNLLAKAYSFDDGVELQIPTQFHSKGDF